MYLLKKSCATQTVVERSKPLAMPTRHVVIPVYHNCPNVRPIGIGMKTT